MRVEGNSVSTFYPTDFTPEVLADVAEERVRQYEKWGPQHHRDGYRPAWANEAQYYKLANAENVARTGDTDWASILLEEVFEALEQGETLHDPSTRSELRAELVQVAAVAVAWIEDIDSRKDSRG